MTTKVVSTYYSLSSSLAIHEKRDQFQYLVSLFHGPLSFDQCTRTADFHFLSIHPKKFELRHGFLKESGYRMIPEYAYRQVPLQQCDHLIVSVLSFLLLA